MSLLSIAIKLKKYQYKGEFSIQINSPTLEINNSAASFLLKSSNQNYILQYPGLLAGGQCSLSKSEEQSV